jgi:hypothetical protein
MGGLTQGVHVARGDVYHAHHHIHCMPSHPLHATEAGAVLPAVHALCSIFERVSVEQDEHEVFCTRQMHPLNPCLSCRKVRALFTIPSVLLR